MARELIETDVQTFFYWLRRNLFLLMQPYKETNPTYFHRLEFAFNILPDAIEYKNFYIEFGGISIKLSPLSSNLTEVFINNMRQEDNEYFERLSTNLDSHPLRINNPQIFTEPDSTDPNEWFLYREKTGISLKYISEKVSLSYGYVRTLHANWIKER